MASVGELPSFLRDLLTFLDSLRNVKLTDKLEQFRVNLLSRTKDTLASPICSPGIYIDMNGKGFPKIEKPDESTYQPEQDYYEACEVLPEQVPETLVRPKTPTLPPRAAVKESDSSNSALMNYYANITAIQARSKASKSGTLSRKEGKMLFLFEQFRPCWAALVETHLLIYGAIKESKPMSVIPIQGYKVQPAPNIVVKDPLRSLAAFEVYRPGFKTLQFVAQTEKDRIQWVTAISDAGSRIESEITDERYSNTTSLISNVERSPKHSPVSEHKRESRSESEGLTRKGSTLKLNKKLPPLPIQGVRSLPSIPHEEVIPSYEDVGERKDDNGIYSTVEDMKAEMDIFNAMKAPSEENTIPTDGVTTVRPNVPLRTTPVKTFLGSLMSRMEGQKKTQTDAVEALPLYDDVGKYNNGEQIPEYQEPPSPKPVHFKQPPVDTEEIYDDANCAVVHSSMPDHINTSPKAFELKPNDSSLFPKSGAHRKLIIDPPPEPELEHYQIPKSDCIRRSQIRMEVEEELYDDITILSEKMPMSNSANEKNNQPSASPEKMHWNRFSSGKKFEPAKGGSPELKKPCSSELQKNGQYHGASNEQHTSPDTEDTQECRKTKFMSLLNKIESSTNRTSSNRTLSKSFSMKGHTSNNIT